MYPTRYVRTAHRLHIPCTCSTFRSSSARMAFKSTLLLLSAPRRGPAAVFQGTAPPALPACKQGARPSLINAKLLFRNRSRNCSPSTQTGFDGSRKVSLPELILLVCTCLTRTARFHSVKTEELGNSCKLTLPPLRGVLVDVLAVILAALAGLSAHRTAASRASDSVCLGVGVVFAIVKNKKSSKE